MEKIAHWSELMSPVNAVRQEVFRHTDEARSAMLIAGMTAYSFCVQSVENGQDPADLMRQLAEVCIKAAKHNNLGIATTN